MKRSQSSNRNRSNSRNSRNSRHSVGGDIVNEETTILFGKTFAPKLNEMNLQVALVN